ncbi:MAG: trans-aconitate 2-methyltransferase [Sphingobium sp.]
MVEAEFDAVASDYTAQHARSIRLSGEDVGYFAHYKIADARKIADRRNLTVQRIMDFGAGIGNSLQPMRAQFPDAHIACLDVSDQSLDLCRSELSGGVDFRVYDGVQIPGDLGSFDLIFTACVFHHIPATTHISLLSQIRDRLTPDGIFLLFEHNPWNPLTRHAVKNCPFDEHAVLISAPEMRRRLLAAGFRQVRIDYRVFFPGPLSALRIFEPALVRVPMGAQYSLTAC